MPYGGGYSSLSSKNSRLNLYNFIKNSKRGAILIEFAFAIPVLLSLIYYVHDLALIKKYYQDNSFVAHQIANIFQNVTQQRENKKITLQDFRDAHVAAWHAVYPGTTMFSQNSGHAFGHMPRSQMFYIKGLPNNKASCLWRAFCATQAYSENPSRLNTEVAYSQNDAAEWITQYKTNVTPTEIHPNLNIKEGEIKIIIDVASTRRDGRLPDGRIVSFKEAFKLFLINPQNTHVSTGNVAESTVIFTPKPGLFSETPPK